MKNWNELTMEVVREHFRQQILEEHEEYQKLHVPTEGLLQTRKAKERHQVMLDALKEDK